MNLIPVGEVDRKKLLPFSLGTLYNWHYTKKYPALLVKVGNRVFLDLDEWGNMARKARDKQVKDAKQSVS